MDIIASSMSKATIGTPQNSKAMMVTAAAGAAVVGGSVLLYRSASEDEQDMREVVTSAEREPGEGFEEEKMLEDFSVEEEENVETKEYKFLRLAKAPPGKLGFYVKMSPSGPVVSKLKPDSVLQEVIAPNDVIVSVNGVDVREMSTEEFHETLASTSEDTRDIVFETTKLKYIRHIEVPEGKLGLYMKSTTMGPTLINMKDDSPLQGIMCTGDVLAAIDHVQTQEMSAPAVRAIMKFTQDKARTFTLESDYISPSHFAPSKTEGDSAESAASEGPAVEDQEQAPPQSAYSRTIVAQPGKLGIWLSSGPRGPTVHNIKPTSQLNGSVLIGDVITSFDGINTRNMLGTDLSEIMARSTDKVRTIVVENDVPEGEVEASQELGAQAVTLTEEATQDFEPPKPKRVSRDVVAQPGKLGLYLATTEAGPLISKVKPSSQLKDSVLVGDIIKYFDGIDTSVYTATAVSAMMSKNLDRERTIVVENEEGVEPVVKDNPEASEIEPVTEEEKKERETVNDEEDEAPYFCPKETVDVDAPAGRMGLNMRASSIGSIIHRVKPGSPLEGIVSPGDIIISIDGVDTRSMSSAQIANFLSQSGSTSRRLSLLDMSKDVPIVGEKVEI